MRTSPLRHRLRFARWLSLWSAVAVAATCLTASAQEAEEGEEADQPERFSVTMAESDSIQFQPAGNGTARVELNLERSPNTSNGATLKAANSEDFVFWSAPLSRRGNRWTTEFDREAFQSMLIVDRLIAEFPGAAPDGEVLHLVIPRERLTPAMEPLAPLVAGDPLFFNAPTSPERPEVPSVDVERVRAESFAMLARQWERELAAYIHQFEAARARAHALFLDLRTADRLPWPRETINQLEQSYGALKEHAESLERMISEWRSTAQNFVRQWNAAHGREDPVQLKFADAS